MYRRANLLSRLFVFTLMLVITCLFFLLWFRPLRIAGDSMMPALAKEDIVLVDCLTKYWKQPQRGDIVCFKDAYGVFVKRIIALPGETIDIKDGLVYIDGCPLDETAYREVSEGNMSAITVPEGSVFVLGDMRTIIYDSRLESVGCIPYVNINGILRVRLTPLKRFTFFV